MKKALILAGVTMMVAGAVSAQQRIGVVGAPTYAPVAAPVASGPVFESSQPSDLLAGTRQIDLTGSLGFSSGTQFSLSLGGGYFFFDGLEVRGAAGMQMTSGGEYRQFGAVGGVEYNFIQIPSYVIPYLGAEMGVRYAKLVEGMTAFVFGGYAGGRYFIAPTVALALEVFVEGATDDIYYHLGANPEDAKSIEWGFRLKTGFYF